MLSTLSSLLVGRCWRDANEETRRLLRELSFAPSVIRHVDALWVGLSDRRFGFSVQSALWVRKPGYERVPWKPFQALGDKIGWRRSGRWACWSDVECWAGVPSVPVIDIRLDLAAAPVGLLPFHDVVTDGNWLEEFSPSDCWGEEAWTSWARVLETFRGARDANTTGSSGGHE
jgi:hypothetical protein